MTYLQWRSRYTRKSDAPATQLIWVDPASIEEVAAAGIYFRSYGRNIDEFSRPSYLEWANAGDVLRGNWDLNRVQFADIAEYRAIKHRFVEDGEWVDTALYRHAVSRIRNGSPAFNAQTEEELIQHFNDVDRLYRSIRDNGYRRNHVADTEKSERAASIDEVTVNIGRSGDLLYHNRGRHRLAIAQLLEIDKIPVLVHVRHDRWQCIRDEILSSGRTSIAETESSAIQNHPDLHELSPVSSH